MTFTTAGAFQTVVDSGHERRTTGVLKHLGLADVSSLRVGDNLLAANTLSVGKGVEVLFVKSNLTGYIQAFDRDIQNYLDLAIYGKNIIFAPQIGGRVNLPANTVTEFWDSKADGNGPTLSVTAWTAYDVPGLTPITFTLRAAARVRAEWFCNYAPPAPGTTYFKASIDGSNELDVPDNMWTASPATAHGWGVFPSLAAGTHTAKLQFTPTQNGTFTRYAWYTRFSVTASYT